MSFRDAIWNGEIRSYSCPRTEESLEGLSGVCSYIDNTVVYNDSWEEHLRTLKELFGRLRIDRITAQRNACKDQIRWSSSVINIGGDVITLSGDNLEKVGKTPHATTKKQVRS